MKNALKTVSKLVASACLVLGVSTAHSAVYTPNFGDFSFPGTQYDVNAAANSFFYTNYGLTIDNMYLYRDSRDTFDGIGVANGLVSQNNVPDVTGRINFVDTTDFVSIDYLAILSTTFSAFTSGGVLIDSFIIPGGTANGSRTLTGSGLISYVTITSTGGYGAVSGLTYNYDGTTDGTNTDITPVPEPGSLAMLGLGLFGLAAARRAKKKSAK